MIRSSALPFLLCVIIKHIDAFGLMSTSTERFSNFSPSFTIDHPPRLSTALYTSEGGAEEVEAENTDGETAEADDTTNTEVDVEVEILTEKISQMEKTLEQKGRDLGQIQDLCFLYSEQGYARKVAQMEDYTRSKKVNKAQILLMS